MTEVLKRKLKHKRSLSDVILDYDKKTYNELKEKDESKDILINSFNECSDLRRSLHDNIKNIFTDLGFSSMKDIQGNDHPFSTLNYPNDEKNKNYCYNGEITIVKNNSVSKFGIKNNKIINLNKNQKQIKMQNKPITTIREKILQKEKLEDFNIDENEFENENPEQNMENNNYE